MRTLAAAALVALTITEGPFSRVCFASEIIADGNETFVISILDSSMPTSCTISATNGASVVPFDPNYLNYPPVPGQASVTVTGNQIVSDGGLSYTIGLLQAPDILKAGPNGVVPSYSSPVELTYYCNNLPQYIDNITLVPPPVYFLHGLWGSDQSLSALLNYLSQQTLYSNEGALWLTQSQYDGSMQAYNSQATMSQILTEVSTIQTSMARFGFRGQIDVVAHSMGGLVSSAFSGTSLYKTTFNRMAGSFHHIITLDTPEAGSGLANFLYANQSVPMLGSGADPNVVGVLNVICSGDYGTTATVADCFNTFDSPIGAALQSLETTNAFPSPNIAYSTWDAIAAVVNQSNETGPTGNGQPASALVWELDAVIAATCPGPSYCPNASSPIPTIQTELGTPTNDGVVPKSSQFAGGPYTSTVLDGLAHTPAPFYGLLSQGFPNLANNNVVTSAAVQSDVYNLLTGQYSKVLPVERIADQPKKDLGFDPTVPIRTANRIVGSVPKTIPLGSTFKMQVRFPLEKILVFTLDEFKDSRGATFSSLTPELRSTPDGLTEAIIPALRQGHVRFVLHAAFRDRAFSSKQFWIDVAPPEEKPASFTVDWLLDRGQTIPLHLRVGQVVPLQPAITFFSSPQKVSLEPGTFTASALDQAGEPVVAVDAAGQVTALREGTATVRVTIGSLAADQPIIVESNTPARRCLPNSDGTTGHLCLHLQ